MILAFEEGCRLTQFFLILESQIAPYFICFIVVRVVFYTYRCYGLPFFCRISPIPNVKSPKVSITIPTYKMKISLVGSVICLPIAAAKKPKLMVIAEIGNESRAIRFQPLDNEAWSAKN